MAAQGGVKTKLEDSLLKLEQNIVLKRSLAHLNTTTRKEEDPYEFLRPKQSECVRKCVENGSDLLAVLATGAGKSLVFQLVPIYQYFYKRFMQDDRDSIGISLVISPLNAILSQQKEMFGDAAILLGTRELKNTSSSESSTDEDEAESNVQTGNPIRNLSGNIKYILGHPEDFLEKATVDILKNAKWIKHVSHIIVDEAHCVVTWSEDFRPKYKDIDQLRSVFRSANIIALTATATARMQQDIIRLLGMTHPAVVTASVDRPNIKYIVTRRQPNSGGGKTVESSYTNVLMPYLEDLRQDRDLFPKTVMYCGLKWCGYANELGVNVLSSDDSRSAGVEEIAQFHAPLLPEMKVNLVKKMADPQGHLRLLFATEAFGMGVDTPDI